MKRYYTPDIVFGPVSEDEEVHSVYKASEVQALLRAVAEEVGKVRHEQSCRAHKRCKICDKPPWANDHRADIPSHHAHVFSPWGCDCPRGRALALLEAK